MASWISIEPVMSTNQLRRERERERNNNNNKSHGGEGWRCLMSKGRWWWERRDRDVEELGIGIGGRPGWVSKGRGEGGDRRYGCWVLMEDALPYRWYQVYQTYHFWITLLSSMGFMYLSMFSTVFQKTITTLHRASLIADPLTLLCPILMSDYSIDPRK